jgi:hypothetical protein
MGTGIRAFLTAAVICVAAGCTTFEDPSIVLDLRIVAITATLEPLQASIINATPGPEQVIDIDLTKMPSPSEILAQLRPTTIEVVIADPAAHRDLRWAMRLCILGDDDRCDETHPVIELGSGVISDPDDSLHPQRPNADVIPDQKLLAILKEAVEENPVQALGGIEYGVEVEIGDLVDPAARVFGAKHLRVAGRIPAGRGANMNPYINYLDAAIGGIGILIPRCRCAEFEEVDCNIPEMDAGTTVTLFPVEPESVRETYSAPTLTGGSAQLTETVTYQWLAAAGSFSDETTGGGHDILGNQSLLGTEWRSPRGLREPKRIPIWMVQRDERYGVNVLESCIQVVPPL